MELQKPRGTRDFLFKEMKQRKFVENTMRKVFETYGFQEIKTPIFEDLSLFTKKSGEGIMKEIYHFQDKGGRELALRPELTAPVARLYLNHLQKAAKPIKMYYFGSCFRYERPQAGRFRQFWQLGCELIGGKSPESEAEIIAMAANCLEKLKLQDYTIHIGNLGILRGILSKNGVSSDKQDKIMALIDKGDISSLKSLLTQLKLSSNSIKILLTLVNTKGNYETIRNVKNLITDYPDALASLEELEELLKMLEVFGFTNYTVDLSIARGLDYYTGTVFEIYVESLGAQKQISGGGTYNLIEVFGGEKVESTGFAFGFDRVMEALKIQEPTNHSKKQVDVFIAPLSDDMKTKSFEIAQKLRKKGISTDVGFAGRKVKKVFSSADNLGASFVVLVGTRDMKEGKVTIKDMKSREQDQILERDIVEYLIMCIYSDEIKKYTQLYQNYLNYVEPKTFLEKNIIRENLKIYNKSLKTNNLNYYSELIKLIFLFKSIENKGELELTNEIL